MIGIQSTNRCLLTELDCHRQIDDQLTSKSIVPSLGTQAQITNNKRNNRPNNEASRRTLLFGSSVSFGMRVPAERPNLCYHLSLISHTVGDSEITLRVVALLRTDPTAKQLTKFSN